MYATSVDYVEHLDNVLKTTGEKVLEGAGTISHAQASCDCLKVKTSDGLMRSMQNWKSRQYEIIVSSRFVKSLFAFKTIDKT